YIYIFIMDLKKLVKENKEFRKVIQTSAYSQLVMMNIPVGNKINAEIHYYNDQFFYIISGFCKVIVNQKEFKLSKGHYIMIKAGLSHEIVNNSPKLDLKFFTIYSPPEVLP